MKVLITSAANDGGLAAAQSLARAGFSVIGTDIHCLPRAFCSRSMGSYHRLIETRDEKLDDALVRLVKSVRPDVFLPLGTKGIRAAARRHDELAAMTAVNVVDEAAFMAAFNKSTCIKECRRLDINCVSVLEFDQALAALEGSAGEISLIVKPSWDAGGALGVCLVRSAAELRRAVQHCSRTYGGYLIQDYIPGPASAMRTVVLLFGPQTELAASFTMQKLRHWPSIGGPTVVGKSTDEPTLVEQVLPFFRAWRWRGPAEVELKLDPRDGQFKVIEINPRFPGYLRFPCHCGLDLPLLSARLALRDPRALHINKPVYRIDQRYLAPTLFVQTIVDDFHTFGPGSAVRKARTDVAGTAPIIVEMLSDPLPLIARMVFSQLPQVRRP